MAWMLTSIAASLMAQTNTATRSSSPCANADSLKLRTDRICAEVLPVSLRAYYAVDEQTSCFCECERLKGITMAEFDSLRYARSVRYARSLKQCNDDFKGIKVHAGQAGSGETTDCGDCGTWDDLSGNVFLCNELLCPEDERLNDALERIIASGLTFGDVAEYWFTFCSEVTSCQEQFTSITGSGRGSGFPTVYIPSSMLRHPAIGDELLMFFLLHEIGHGVTRYGGDTDNSEPDADVWAVEMGFNAVYGADYAAAVTDAVAQLEAYYAACFAPTVVNLPHAADTGGQVNNYPKLACRTGLMEAVAGADLVLDDIDAYVDAYMTTNHCWDGAVATAPSSSTWATDCGSDCGRTKKGEDPYDVEYLWRDCMMVKSDRAIRLLEGSPEFWSSVVITYRDYEELYCIKHPERCSKMRLVVGDSLSLPIPRDKDMVRITEEFDRALRLSDRRFEAVRKKMLRLRNARERPDRDEP